jgi:NitT/TauT family transport system substrate-binding protein
MEKGELKSAPGVTGQIVGPSNVEVTMVEMRAMVRTSVAVMLLLGLLAGCAPSRRAGNPETVTLAMGYIPSVQFAPFYVAVEKGYFDDEGIEIKFDYGWETDLLKLVGTDELQFAIASGDQVILARSQGLPVVYVMNWYRRFPVVVASLPERGIRQAADLVGRRVGTPATYGASYIGWRALLDASGIKETDVNLISIGYTQVAALSQGQVDAAICYAMNEPVQMEAEGQSLNILYVADFANLVSNGLITNEKSVRERPGLVQGMTRAALRGLAYTIQHPEEAFDITSKYVPEVLGDAQKAAVNRAVLARSIEFWQADPAQLGRSNIADWQISLQIMQKMDLVGPEADLQSMFTNQFVVEVKD